MEQPRLEQFGLVPKHYGFIRACLRFDSLCYRIRDGGFSLAERIFNKLIKIWPSYSRDKHFGIIFSLLFGILVFLSGLVCYLALIGFQIENCWEWILLPLLVFTIGCWAIGVILLIVMVLMLIVFNLLLRNLPYVRAHRKFGLNILHL